MTRTSSLNSGVEFTLPDEWFDDVTAAAFHLGGKHNQKSHGHGGGGPLATVDDSKIKKARESYDARVGKAKTEGDVYGATPLGIGKPGAPPENAEVVGALENYAGSTGYYDVNQGLRNAHGHADEVVKPPARAGSPPSKIDSDEKLRGTIDTMDRGMGSSHLSDDVVLHRVVADPESLFGSAYHRDGDNSGLTWMDHGFTSTTLSEHGISFQQGRLRGGTEAPESGGQLVMRVLAPKGTHALIGNNREGEIILDRGLRFRVVRDHGIDDRTRRDMELKITRSYVRHVDVEIIDG